MKKLIVLVTACVFLLVGCAQVEVETIPAEFVLGDAQENVKPAPQSEPPGYVEAEDIISKLPGYADEMPNCNSEQFTFTSIADDTIPEELNRELGLSMFKKGYYNSDGCIMFYEDGIQPSELNRALEQSAFNDNYQFIWGMEGGDFDVVLIFADYKSGEEISDVIHNIVIGRY